jgi:tetratricopeptide (TPR) repeat protein
MTYYLLGDYRKALDDFQKAFALDGASVEIINNLGVTFSRLGKDKKAHKYFLEAVRLRPNFDRAQFNLALSYHKLGNRDEALKHFMRLKELDGNLAEMLRKEMSKQFIVNASQLEN